jgi:hypothetical protein
MNRPSTRKRYTNPLLPSTSSKRWWLFQAELSEIKEWYIYWDKLWRIMSYWKQPRSNQKPDRGMVNRLRLSTTNTRDTKTNEHISTTNDYYRQHEVTTHQALSSNIRPTQVSMNLAHGFLLFYYLYGIYIFTHILITLYVFFYDFYETYIYTHILIRGPNFIYFLFIWDLYFYSYINNDVYFLIISMRSIFILI